ncbi:MAG TPA: YWFCY domain-containing protein [Flavisolibacter sp.]|jgi:hypothetical protein|nr:YWFCY domain-containing protein [Flavisolibacter sp.]
MNSTGENEKGLKEILDFTRLAAIIVLLIHFYFYCYAAFKQWNLTTEISDRFLQNFVRAGLFKSILHSKLIALGLLIISILGPMGRKDERARRNSIIIYLSLGLAFYFFSHVVLQLNGDAETVAVIYMTVTSLGFILVLTGDIHEMLMCNERDICSLLHFNSSENFAHS